MPEEFIACDNNRGVSAKSTQPVQKDNIHGNQTPFAAGNPRSSLLELARLASAGRAFLPLSGGCRFAVQVETRTARAGGDGRHRCTFPNNAKEGVYLADPEIGEVAA